MALPERAAYGPKLRSFDEGAEDSRPRLRAFDPGYDKVSRSRKQEKRLAASLGAKVQIASGAFRATHNVRGGAGFGLKGDVVHRKFLIEAKRTDKNRLTIEGAWLDKIGSEAEMQSKLPALAIEISGTSPLTETDWVLIPASVFKKFCMKEKE